jgi:beta-glucosidase/6-phospho-beta-glucosidase/beta-galactosidase
MQKRFLLMVPAVLGLALAPSCKSSTDATSSGTDDGGITDEASAPPPPAQVTFPASFTWGSATAAFQVEKGLTATDWGAWVQTTGKIKNMDLPDVGGPDALAHVDEDIALLKASGQNAYRFSIEWARMYPTKAAFDADTPDMDAVTAYDALLTKLKAAGIAPWVTLHHFSTPSWLSDPSMGSQPQAWERPEMAALFVEWSKRIATRWGDKIDDYITINEPLNLALGGYVQGSFPPGQLLAMDRTFAVVKAETRAHAKAFEAIHAADKTARVSMAFHQRGFHPYDPANPDDVEATARLKYIWNAWLMNAVVKGDWDDDYDQKYDGPNDKQGDPTLKGHVDYLGVNYYSDTLVARSHGVVIPLINVSVLQDHLNTGRPKNEMWWDVYPQGMREVLDQAKAYGLPIVITENGIADSTDVNRARYLTEHLQQVGAAIAGGADVRGYFHWSLIDNFEWANGFCPKFGLAAYDQKTKARTLRASGQQYKKIIDARKITQADVDSLPAYKTAPVNPCN